MSYFLKNISFHGILLDSLFEAGNNAWKSVHLLVDEGIKSGVVKPLKTTVFNRENVEAAFRYMAQGKHIGKILIEVNSGGKLTNENAVPKYFCDSKKSYVIIGGLGGFGLELAQWLATRGARSIVLTSRSGIKNGYQARKIRKLRKIGIDVRVCRKNAGDVQEAMGIIEECGMPCGGIFNTAMVLEDGLIENQTVERFQKVIEPKLTAAINLDKVTRQLCVGTCDLFVMFSSVSSGRGNAGQSNYGFANSGMEMICEQRRRDGLHGLAIQWGVIGDVGVLFEQSGSNETEIAGVVSQRIRSCLATLDTFLTQSAPIVTSFVQAKAKMANKEKDSGNTDQNLLKAVCNIIGINDASKVDKKLQLEDMGLDSLMAVEIKQTIERLVDVGLTTTEIRKLTLNGIKELVNERSLRLDYGQGAKNKENVDRDPKWSLDDILIPVEMIVPLNKFESIKDPIYFIHTVEGSTGILRHVASFIDRPAFGIQSTKNVPQSSITDMAAFYLQAILEHNRSQEFHLAGYSFGGMIAMEIGHQIQRSSHSSKLLSLTLLDGTPLSVSSSIRMFYESQDITNELDKQSVPLAVLGGLLLGEEAEPIFKTLKTLPTFDVRADMLLSRLAGYKLAVSRKDLVDAVKAYKQRHATALAYSFPGKYKGDVVLIVPGHWTIERKTLGQDQGLKKIVDGSVNVYEVPGRHLTFLQGSSGQQVANHINEDLNKRTQ